MCVLSASARILQTLSISFTIFHLQRRCSATHDGDKIDCDLIKRSAQERLRSENRKIYTAWS